MPLVLLSELTDRQGHVFAVETLPTRQSTTD
jgi:hypothetical protein